MLSSFIRGSVSSAFSEVQMLAFSSISSCIRASGFNLFAAGRFALGVSSSGARV